MSPSTSSTSSSRSSHRSSGSQESQSTAPSSISSTRPSLAFWTQPRQYSYDADLTTIVPRSSTETYTSTIASVEELYQEPEEYITDPKHEIYESNIRASTAQDFAQYFPTTNRLLIRHDDSTFDGNENLRVDAEIGSGNSKSHVQLFHLRMHDIKAREFSLRRYSRDSGREVCHSTRKFTTKSISDGRPSLQRSMSTALATIRGKPDFKRTNSGLSHKALKRHDSGYGSSSEDAADDDVASFMSSSTASGNRCHTSQDTNVTKLEFSNYAHVDVKCAHKKCEFEYWGTNYTWKRISDHSGHVKSISYHLIKETDGSVVARIVPELRSPSQVQAEEQAGGWVPPCSMWICDRNILNSANSSDVADVIIATGLTALTDDCIHRQWGRDPKVHTFHLGVPLTPLKMEMEYVGPKAIMEQVFKRRNSGSSNSSAGSTKHSPLRHRNAIEAF